MENPGIIIRLSKKNAGKIQRLNRYILEIIPG